MNGVDRSGNGPVRTGLLDAAAIRAWCTTGLAALTAARSAIDAVNVFPVADGDTGTNLVLTMQAVVESVAAQADRAGHHDRSDLAATARAMARGALLGAQGNSGLILSEYLRGIAEVLGRRDRCGAAEWTAALTRAAEMAYAAVDNPVEGTVLSVARAAAHAAAAADSVDVAAVAAAAAAGAADALAATPGQLPVLAAAHVVDAGGWGLVVLLEALCSVLGATGDRPGSQPVAPELPARASGTGMPGGSDRGSCPSADPTFGYEVQYLLAADEAAVRVLTGRLRALGNSLTIAGGGSRWSVHVHVDDVGAAIEAGINAGRPYQVQVTRFADQQRAGTDRRAGHRVGAQGRELCVVAANGGLAGLVSAAGARLQVAAGSQGAAALESAAAELAGAVSAGGAAEVVLLPTAGSTAEVAAAAAAEIRKRDVAVAVVPTRSSMQALAALAVAQPSRAFQDDVIAMTAAAGATRWAEVQRAPGRYQTSAGICEPGDVLGLIEDDVVVIGSDIETTAAELLERLLTGGGELVTVVTGPDAGVGLGERLAATAAARWPAAEVVVYAEHQLDRPVLLGIE